MSGMCGFIRNNFEELHKLLDEIKVGIWITDAEGKVIFISRESEKTGGLKEKDLLGKTMSELLDEGYILYDSSVLKAIESGKRSSLVQELGDGGHIYATSNPIYEEGEMSVVVCTERDITETVQLRKLLEEQKKLAYEYQSELDYIRQNEISVGGVAISESPAMYGVMDMAMRTAKKDVTIMLEGESGTGKEYIANIIYENSRRKGKPFIKVNCAAIPETLMESEFFGYERGAFTGAGDKGKEGLFEMADGGILFLDEVGDLPLHMQPKLLRVLQEKEIRRVGGVETISVDVRIISATNVNLDNKIKSGEFREDLYYRLNIVNIDVPPLRERREDIEGLTRFFLRQFNKVHEVQKTISKEAVDVLKAYDWPGNVRELRNVVESLVVSTFNEEINEFQVRLQLSKHSHIYGEGIDENYIGRSLETMMEEFEKSILITYYERENSISGMAKLLGVNKSTISRKMKKHGIVIK